MIPTAVRPPFHFGGHELCLLPGGERDEGSPGEMFLLLVQGGWRLNPSVGPVLRARGSGMPSAVRVQYPSTSISRYVLCCFETEYASSPLPGWKI